MGCSSSVALPEFDASLSKSPGGASHRYELKEKLGSGSFGEVRGAVSDATQTQRAVKVISLHECASQSSGVKKRKTVATAVDRARLKDAQREAEIWAMVGKHANCVELLRTFVDAGSFYMVMDRCEGNLLENIRAIAAMSEVDLARIFKEMLLGVAHVHSKRIAHRDVKPDNFLLGGLDGKEVKLCDFGLAAVEPKHGLLYGTHGTAPYMSPEMAGKQGHSRSTDIWSLGATAYLLLYRDFPYMPSNCVGNDPAMVKRAIVGGIPRPSYRRRTLRERKKSGEVIKQPCAEAYRFVSTLLERGPPSKRITAEEALQLDFVSKAFRPPASSTSPTSSATEGGTSSSGSSSRPPASSASPTSSTMEGGTSPPPRAPPRPPASTASPTSSTTAGGASPPPHASKLA